MKKDDLRFNIRFNPIDPRHIKAAKILNDAGRRKASIVANALWEYELKYEPRQGTGDELPVSEEDYPPWELPAKSSNDETDNTLQNSILAALGQFRDD